MTTRSELIDAAGAHLHSGAFLSDLQRLIAYPTVSSRPEGQEAIQHYLDGVIIPRLEALGCTTKKFPNWNDTGNSFLIATLVEDESLPTVLTYGHADVIDGLDEQWTEGRVPFELRVEGERWYGRGTADNKAQHLVNLTSLELMHAHQGRLGFNLTVLFEAGEEISSPGLAEFVSAHTTELAADVFIASDGPRLDAGTPTLFLGNRGGVKFRLSVPLAESPVHSGNWGGLARNPATTLAGAINHLVDGHGRLQHPELQPAGVPDSVRRALSGLNISRRPGDPAVDDTWGHTEFTEAERLYAWNTLEVLAMNAADLSRPVNAIPASAEAVLQLRFVVGTDVDDLTGTIKDILAEAGYGMVDVEFMRAFPASRTDPDDGWAQWARASVEETMGSSPAVLPNFGGSLPNRIFSDTLGLSTVWVPHSYPGCLQHAANEHVLEPIMDEALRIMTGLWWDLGQMRDPR